MSSAKCERTGKTIPISEGFFVADQTTGEWSFVGIGAPEKYGDYNVPIDDICKSPEALIDWIAHLSEKTWFDGKKFTDFFARFRKENNLYGAL